MRLVIKLSLPTILYPDEDNRDINIFCKIFRYRRRWSEGVRILK